MSSGTENWPVQSEQVENLIRQAYEQGWKSARYWPNQPKPWALKIVRTLDSENDKVLFKIIEKTS